MKKLSLSYMEKFQGGQVQNCNDFMIVLQWLSDNGHNEQLMAVTDAYYDQYCSSMSYPE
nr:hypothetical protein [uncultured Marinifilum sp.]